MSFKARYDFDGRIKYNRRWVGRWYVEVGGGTPVWRSRGGQKGWRVKPLRAFDPVYLFNLHRKMKVFNSVYLWEKYLEAVQPCFDAFPEGGQIHYNSTTIGGGDERIYYDIVYVPRPRRKKRGLSFGSGTIEPKETHPLKRLAEEKELWKHLESIEAHGQLGATVNQAFRRRSQGWGRTFIVKGMLFNAITRHLPNGWGYEQHDAGPAVQVRVLDTVYYFQRAEPGRGEGGAAGWNNILILVDGDEENRINFNFQSEATS